MANTVLLHPDNVYRTVNSGDTVVFNITFSNLGAIDITPYISFSFLKPGAPGGPIGAFDLQMLGVQDLQRQATYNFSAIVPTGIPSGEYHGNGIILVGVRGMLGVVSETEPASAIQQLAEQYCLNVVSSLEERGGAPPIGLVIGSLN
jgi:hypothetical protein